MMRSTLPLFPSDDGWPYPDTDAAVEANLLRNGFVVDDEVDLDALELSADPHAFDGLTLAERGVIERRFGHGDSMKTIACDLGLHARRGRRSPRPRGREDAGPHRPRPLSDRESSRFIAGTNRRDRATRAGSR